jgi:general stress protein 26
MKRAARYLLSAAFCALPLGAQTPASPPVDLPAAACSIVTAAQYATFVTVDRRGQPQSRTVQPVAPDSAWEVWFATNPRTRKVQQLRTNSRVALHYFDQARLSYVAIIGRAYLVTDRATKQARWNSAWTPFYADQDTSVTLVRVVPDRVEVVSTKLGVDSDKTTWLPSSFVPKRR